MTAPSIASAASVGLDNLAKLAPLPKKMKRAGRSTGRVAKAALSAASILVWRLAPTTIVKALKSRVQAKRRARRNAWIVAGVGGAAAVVALLARWQLQRLFTPEPHYDVELKNGNFELRRYGSVRVASTTIDNAGWNDALNSGFRRLADFIFGDNDTRQRIKMTAPVLGTAKPSEEGYRFLFVLPENLQAPVPNDKRVEVSDIPARRVGVLRFRGRYDAAAIQEQKRELLYSMMENGLKPRGEVTFAGYDPPSTLPVLRRNELWVEIDD